jgi:ATP-dependent helicase/nuclease subunit A
LNEFLAFAMQYGQTHPPSLQGFLHWLDAGEIQIKRDMEKGSNEVRILTVHGAKGLQAPIVFLPDTARIPPPEGGILWTQSDESVPLFSPMADYDDRHYRALKAGQRTDAQREYRRLLYVAMTRAEDELYVLGWKGDKVIAEASWYELVRRAAEGWETEGDKRLLTCAQLAAVKSEPSTAAAPLKEPLPEWVAKPAADEPIPSRPLSPSRLQPVADALPPFAAQARARGILVHRLLQYLPDVSPDERGQVMARFINRYGGELPKEEQEDIGREVLGILTHSEFAPVFGPDSAAEVSIVGVAGGRNAVTIAGRIDRIAVLPHAVYIIDYKTGRKVPVNEAEIPESYLRQMEAYRQVVIKIYPDKTVYCGLLWTTGPRLVVLSDALLESLAA